MNDVTRNGTGKAPPRPRAPVGRAWRGSAACLAALVGCSRAPTARDVFESRALPVLESTCAAATCHGVAPDAEARGERVDWNQLFFRLSSSGAIADPAQAYEAAKRRINTTEDPAFSSLLRKPLAVASGGVGHLGGGNFWSPEDPGYRALHEWIALEAGGGEDPEPLTERERLFADTVQPVLVEATCMTSRCHGPTAGSIPYALDIGYEGRFPAAATRHNYEQTLRMLALDGYPLMSRVLRKAQAPGPGIIHKGMNFDFFSGNPGGGVLAVASWACAERRARTGHDCASPGEPPMSGFVFIRGPITPRHAFDLEPFTPGSDLFLAPVGDATLVPGGVENLTAALHPSGPADVREPAVSRDGERVVFSMRTRSEEGHHLWLLDLRTREARQLTFGNERLPGGGLATDRDPTWGPDDTIWFASTRAGDVADQGRLLDAEIYSLDLATSEMRRWTYTPHVERKPVFFDVGDEAGGEVAFSALRDAIPDQARAHVFRFPPSMSTEYHQHFGITTVQTFLYDMRELPDGRYTGVVGDLPAPWESGALAIVERNFGPEINERSAVQEPANADAASAGSKGSRTCRPPASRPRSTASLTCGSSSTCRCRPRTASRSPRTRRWQTRTRPRPSPSGDTARRGSSPSCRSRPTGASRRECRPAPLSACKRWTHPAWPSAPRTIDGSTRCRARCSRRGSRQRLGRGVMARVAPRATASPPAPIFRRRWRTPI